MEKLQFSPQLLVPSRGTKRAENSALFILHLVLFLAQSLCLELSKPQSFDIFNPGKNHIAGTFQNTRKFVKSIVDQRFHFLIG